MNTWNKLFGIALLCALPFGACGGDDPEAEDDTGSENEEDSPSTAEEDEDEDPAANKDAGTKKDAGKTTSTKDAGKTSTKDAGKTTVKDAGKGTTGGGDDDDPEPTPGKDAGKTPTTPTGKVPPDSTRIGAIETEDLEAACQSMGEPMTNVIRSAGLLDCTGRALNAAGGDRAVCDAAYDACAEPVNAIGVKSSCDENRLPTCSEATLGQVRSCLAAMQAVLDEKNDLLSCSSTLEDYMVEDLPPPSACEGQIGACSAISGLVRIFDWPTDT